MKGPVRLREGGPERVRAILRHGRPTRDMKPDERTRTAARVLGASVVPGTLGFLLSAKSLAMGAAIGLATVVVVAHRVPSSSTSARSVAPPSDNSAPTLAHRSEPRAELEVAPMPTVAAAPAVVPAPAIVRAPQPRSPTTETTERESDALEREAALLESARASLGTAPARALELTERHASSFPSGKLAIERELVAVDALQRLGRHGEARARGEALLRRASGNIYEDRIRRLLEKKP
jgi:hypothetical protein